MAIAELQPGRQIGPTRLQPELISPALTFGGMVRSLRTKGGLNQRDLASRLNTDFSKISSWETGASLPKEEILGRLAKELVPEPNGLAVLNSQYQIERAKRKSDRLKPGEVTALNERLRNHAEGPINYSSLAREFGISTRTVRIRHRALENKDPYTPSNIKDQKVRDGMAFRVKVYRRSGLGILEIAKQLHKTPEFVREVLTAEGEAPRRSPRSKEELMLIDSQIKPLYESGLTFPQISESTGLPRYVVCSSVRRLIKGRLIEGRMARFEHIRAQRRAQILPLLNQRLPHKEIARITGLSEVEVKYEVEHLVKKRWILSRRSERKQQAQSIQVFPAAPAAAD